MHFWKLMPSDHKYGNYIETTKENRIHEKTIFFRRDKTSLSYDNFGREKSVVTKSHQLEKKHIHILPRLIFRYTHKTWYGERSLIHGAYFQESARMKLLFFQVANLKLDGSERLINYLGKSDRMIRWSMQHLAMSHWHDNLWQFHDHKINDVLLLGPGNFIRLRLKNGFS